MNYNTAYTSETSNRNEFAKRGEEFKIGCQDLSAPRWTHETFVLIVYRSDIRKRFRNSIVAHRGISFAYGHGMLFGRCMENTLKVVDGLWNDNNEVGLISFDNKDQAYKFLISSRHIRDQFWLQTSHDIVILPAFSPAIIPHNYRYIQIDWYSVKRSIQFAEYVNGLYEIVKTYGGHFIAASQDLFVFKGICEPNYIIMIQWRSMEEFEQFNLEAGPLFRNSSSACGSRLIYEFETFVYDNA